ncbi:zinc finger, CCHC-type containing protein [Tanacetum coccineum]
MQQDGRGSVTGRSHRSPTDQLTSAEEHSTSCDFNHQEHERHSSFVSLKDGDTYRELIVTFSINLHFVDVIDWHYLEVELLYQSLGDDTLGIHVSNEEVDDDLQLVHSLVSNSGLKNIHQRTHQWLQLCNSLSEKLKDTIKDMSVVYVLTTPMPEDGGENPTVEQVRKRAKWDNDDYVYRSLILNGMSDSLFDVYQNVETSKELWDTLEAKYMAEDASSKKFLVSNFINYKMIDSRIVLEQYNELLGILGRFTQHKMNMDESIQVSCIIDKLLPSWKDFKHTLKHLKEELTLIELGSHLCIEESLRAHDSDKPKDNNVAGSSVVNMVEHNNSSRKPGHLKRDCKAGNVGNKANGSSIKGPVDGSSNPLKGQNMFNKSLQIYYVTNVSKAYFVQDDDVVWWVDSGATVHVCKDRCWFKTYESLNDGSILNMGNESTSLVHGRGCVDLRLGHVHFKRMQDMSKDGLIPSFDMDTKKCKTCMLTKITKKPFQNVKRETKVLELIYSDLCDMHAKPSLGNKKCFVTFIDDASRFCYVYLLHSKDEALDKFKVFKTEVELQQGSLIKRVRTDRGGECMDTLYF